MGYDFGSGQSVSQMRVDSFRGVDFASSPVAVAAGRSPNAINVISDLAGKPVKRTGYCLLGQLEDRINGIFRLKTVSAEKVLVHAGTKLYLWNQDENGILQEQFSNQEEEPSDCYTLLYDQMQDERSGYVQYNGKLWILDGKKFLVYGPSTENAENFSLQPVENLAYVPTTRISADPDGENGVVFEDGNLLSLRRKNSFYVSEENASKVSFTLDCKNLSNDITVTAKILEQENTWRTVTEGAQMSVNRTKGIVSFTTAPGASVSIGEDNVVIEFGWEIEGGRNKINQCQFCTLYGIDGSADRLFVSGNPEYGNMDFWSEMDEFTYFPEYNYAKLGEAASDVMGYSKLGSTLVILKESNGQDATVFFRNGSLDNNDEAIFPIYGGVSGIGAISRYGFANLNSEPIFVSAQGVFAIATQDITGEKYAEVRSFYINPKLTQENLSNAVCTAYRNYYYLAVDGNVYVADGRQKIYEENAPMSSFQYEWYFFDHIPARIWFQSDGYLYFGTEDGRICRFYLQQEHTPMKNIYYDQIGWEDGEILSQPVKAMWETPYFSFGYMGHLKRLVGFWLMLAPYYRSGVEIYYRAWGSLDRVRTAQADIFDFNNIDFTRFTFQTDDSPMVVATNKPLRRFMLVQFRFENNEPEGFGFYGFEAQYVIQGRYRAM